MFNPCVVHPSFWLAGISILLDQIDFIEFKTDYFIWVRELDYIAYLIIMMADSHVLIQ